MSHTGPALICGTGEGVESEFKVLYVIKGLRNVHQAGWTPPRTYTAHISLIRTAGFTSERLGIDRAHITENQERCCGA